ncbi:hypothetical protein ACVWWQ_002371 [Rhodanobacter sp. TND4EL1]
MPDYIPAQALIAIGTVAAALIAAALSYVNLTLTKEQKTSQFRQAWIDGLREDLSKFFAALRTVARAEGAFYKAGENYEKQNFPWSSEQVASQRQAASEMLYRIKLRLNPEEETHIELYRLLLVALSEQKKLSKKSFDSEPTIEAIDTASDYARPVLKAEWRRVKAGERPFQIARNWVAPVIIGLCLVFIAVLVFSQFKQT